MVGVLNAAAARPCDKSPAKKFRPVRESAVNKYLQSWDCHNLFVVGANVFPHNASYNPTGPVGALAYWTADAIKNRYLKNPGPLVPT